MKCSPQNVQQAPLLAHDAVNAERGTHVTPVEEPIGILPVYAEESNCIEQRLTPKAVLIVFTLLNLVTYFDRGAIAGSLSAVKMDASIRGPAGSLSDTRSGVVVSGFMIGYMVSCPLFAAVGAYVQTKYIILAGMLVWCVACLSTAVSSSYWMLLCSRLFVGVGEAAFVGFTVTIIDNIAPPRSRTSWIGIFYSMIPVGTALGMGVGGLVSERGAVFCSSLQAWRLVFVGEVVAAVPVLFAIAALPARYNANDPQALYLVPADPRDAPTAEEAASTSATPGPNASTIGGAMQRAEDGEYLPLHKATVALARNVDYLLVVGGLAMYCFAVGAISVWAIPLLAHGPLDLSVSTAAVVMGVSTSLCGIAGSLFGGWALDWLGGSTGLRGSAKCQLFSSVMIGVCIPCGAAALLQTTLVPFLLAFVVSVIALFSVTAPVNAAILTVVPHALRPYAVSYSVFLIHFLGDFPSPTIAGALSDQFSRGCSTFPTSELCGVAPHASGFFSDRQCRWMEDREQASAQSDLLHGGRGHCVNIYQVRDALLVIFAFLVIALPCWIAVYVRLRRKAREEGRLGNSIVVIVSRSPTP